MQYRLRTLLIAGSGCVIALAGILFLCGCLYVGLTWVVGSPSELLGRMMMSREAFVREQAERELAPKGFSLSSEPVVAERIEPDGMELSGHCLDADGRSHSFEVEFLRDGNRYKSVRVLIDNQ